MNLAKSREEPEDASVWSFPFVSLFVSLCSTRLVSALVFPADYLVRLCLKLRTIIALSRLSPLSPITEQSDQHGYSEWQPVPDGLQTPGCPAREA